MTWAVNDKLNIEKLTAFEQELNISSRRRNRMEPKVLNDIVNAHWKVIFNG